MSSAGLRIAPLAAVAAATTLLLLVGCSSGSTATDPETQTTNTSVSPSSAPSGSDAPASTGADPASESPPDIGSPEASALESAAVNDPTWVEGADAYSWPESLPAMPKEFKPDLTQNEYTQAWKTAVVVLDSVGWNPSLMGESGTRELARAAISPWMTGDALAKFDTYAPSYETLTSDHASGSSLGATWNRDNGRTLLEGFTLSSLITYGNPVLRENDLGVIATGMTYDVKDVYVTTDDAVVVRIEMSKDVAVKAGTFNFAPGDEDEVVTFTRDVLLRLVRSEEEPATPGSGGPPRPWLIDDWDMRTFGETDANGNFVTTDTPYFDLIRDGNATAKKYPSL
jgi:hypothetical protein